MQQPVIPKIASLAFMAPFIFVAYDVEKIGIPWYISEITHDSSDIEDIEDDDASIPEDSSHSPREKRSSDLLEDGTEERRTRQRR